MIQPTVATRPTVGSRMQKLACAFARGIFAPVMVMGAAAAPSSSTATLQDPTPPRTEESSPKRTASDRSASLAPPNQRAIDAFLDGRDGDALAEFNRLLKEEPALSDAWTVYRAEALRRLGRREEALAGLAGFEERFPKSPWISKARFNRAELAQAANDSAGAERILREEARSLRGPTRRDELCAIYLEVASQLVLQAAKTPGEEAEQELLERASQILAPALKLETSAPVGAATRAEAARVAMLARDWGAAAVSFDLGLKSFRLGTSGLPECFGVDAQIAMAWAHRQSGNPQRARRILQDLEREVLDMPEAETDPWLAEVTGEILAGIGFTWSEQGRQDLAISAWEKLLERTPSHPMAALSSARMTSAHRGLNRVEEALASAAQTASLPAPLPWAPGRSDVAGLTHRAMGFGTDEDTARSADALAAHALYEQGDILLSVGRYAEALETFTAYVKAHAGEADWAAAEGNIVSATYLYASAQLEATEGDVAKARETLEAFARDFPLDSRRDAARLARAELSSQAAKGWMKGAKEEERRAAHAESVEDLLSLAARTLGSDTASRALYRAAVLCETELEDPARAVDIYRRVNFGPEAGNAREKREAMLQETLRIATPRLIRSWEPLELDVFTRNIDEVDVRSVNLDLGAYFQRHHRIVGIEELDLDLIAADAEYTIAVSDYQRYAPLKRGVAVPLAKGPSVPGAYAVSVVAAGKRATTLVIQSDLDMIAKRSRGEVFVFVTEVQKGEGPLAAEGVEVSVSHTVRGERVLSTMRTGPDGIARLTPPEGEIFDGETRVFAVRDGHVAAVELSAGPSTASAMTLGSRAALHTDRTAYRPGETIEMRAVLRAAEDGRFTIPTESTGPMEVRFQLVAPDGEVAAFTENAPLSPFGTASASFRLDGSAPDGGWTVQVLDTRRNLWASAPVTVAEFEVPRAILTLAAPRSIALRGDTVTVTAKAATGFGVPLAGDTIRWTDPEGLTTDAVLDDEGEATFTMATATVYEDRTLRLRANLPESGNIGASFDLRVAQVALALAIEAEREVVLAGSSFNATLRATAPDGSPMPAQSLTLKAIRTESVGESSYREVTELESTVRTGADGTALVAIVATGGGPITLRVQGRDAFDQRVEAVGSIFASGDDDADKLRILRSDAHRVVGDGTEIEVVDRTGGGLALLTIEGSKVIEHRVVKLNPDVNVLEFEVTDAFVPDVNISIAAIRDRSFHHRKATLKVSRPLELTVELDAEVAPGRETTLTLRTTDGRGAPVSAEVSLSLVDAGLFALYPDKSRDLQEVFAGRPGRTPSFETGASSTFAYRGKTEVIAQAILDEAARDAAQLERQAMAGGIAEAFQSSAGIPMPQAPAPQQSVFFELETGDETNSIIGIGGGAGGRFGGRYGGNKQMGKTASARENGPEENPTAFWSAAVVTDKKSGTATVIIPMPQREARWRLRARGVTQDHRFGEGAAETVTSAPFVLDVNAPSIAFAGDAPRVMAQVFAETPMEKDTKVEWELRATADDVDQVQRAQSVIRAGESRGTVTFDALSPLQETSLPVILAVGAALDTGSGKTKLSASRDLRVRPGGIEVFDTASGTVTDVETVVLNVDGAGRELTLLAGAGASDWLIHDVLYPSAFRGAGGRRVRGPEETAASLFGAAAILNAGGESGGFAEADRLRLLDRCNGLVSGLVARRIGGRGWASSFGSSQLDPEATARVLVALSEARAAGIETPRAAIEIALGYLNESLANERDPERRAWILWGQSAAGQTSGLGADDLALGRMHRERSGLSTRAKGALACALAESGKGAMAAEVADSLRVSGDMSVESRALALLGRACAKVMAPADFEALYGTRPWSSTVGRGLACAASAKAGALAPAGRRSTTFTLRVNGGDVEEYRLDSDRPVLRLVPALGDVEGPVRVELNLRAGERLDYALSLGAVTDKIPDPTMDARIRKREVLSARPRRAGRVLETGFQSVTESRDQVWSNGKSELEFGQEARVLIRIARSQPRDRSETLEDYEVEIPLPAGCVAREFDQSDMRSRMQDGSLFVAFRNRGILRDFEIELVGVSPGVWTLPPPVIRSSADPARVAYGKAATLTVLAPGETTGDKYRPTPDELLDRGRASFEAKSFAEARGALRPLFRDWRVELTPAALAETAKLLLFSSLSAAQAESAGAAAQDAATPNQVVDWFEILKEREPQLFVSFDDTMLVADAYESIGEFDRASSLFRAVIDETFGEDMRVAAALDSLGLWDRASAFIAETWSRYPDSPKAQDADLALAARLTGRGLGDKTFPGASSATRKALVLSGLARLMRIVAVAPESAAADAGLAMVSAFVELEDWENAAERSKIFGAAFQVPRVRDQFRYTEAVSRWSMGQDDEASKLLDSIVDAKYPVEDAGGRTRESENRDLALYILGQIHHARRDPAGAMEYYERVAGQFPDAGAALAELRSERLDLAEDVVRVSPGEKATVAFRHRGIDEVEVLIYPVDLMTLALRERDLSRVTAVDLAGVTPTRTETVELERSILGLESGELNVDLKEPGAYLAMLRAGLEHRSALILVSDIQVDVDVSTTGAVRAHLVRRSDQSFPRGAEIRVLDVRTGTVASGKTDPRGLYTANTTSGNVTVIARTEGKHYAFAGVNQERAMAPQTESPVDQRDSAPAYFQNVLSNNKTQVLQSQDRFEQDVKRNRKGIQVQSAGKRK